MATSIETAHFLAEVTGIAKETMLVQTRRLGEQNLISRGGRGKNAPKMTMVDTARMLIGLLATEIIENMPDGVRAFGQLRMVAGAISTGPGGHSIRISQTDTFEEAIAFVILKLSEMDDPPKDVSILIDVGRLYATVKADGLAYGFSNPSLSDIANGRPYDMKHFDELRARYRNSKVRVTREIGPDILIPIAASFRVQKGA